MAEREKTASPLELQVLALSVKERKGREIGKLIAAETGQAPKWSTLYLTIERLAERGWVTTRQGEVDGRQVRWVKLNKAGTKALNSARQYYTELGRFGARPEFER